MTLHADNPNPNALERIRRWAMPLVDRLNIRVQSDDSAAAGTTGPNYGQAVGWNEGYK